eukprot:CAMPEP_0197526962 /NCGR_PEP_ID=MMETSP1318-20131121/19885_1 /TAXON_ID=552666 /ORGANISM="Partenskyella glossopodia, Strain RCC365" /LENGTH=251 /DNA_ID=CAMNT_0043081373 /DNA_START=419 /DNA_END=1175 /DNA_ORIENTATION=+
MCLFAIFTAVVAFVIAAVEYQAEIADLKQQLQAAKDSKNDLLQFSRRVLDNSKELIEQKQRDEDELAALQKELREAKDSLDAANVSKNDILQFSRRVLDRSNELREEKQQAEEEIATLKDELEEAKCQLEIVKMNEDLRERFEATSTSEQQFEECAEWKCAEEYLDEESEDTKSTESEQDATWTSAEDYDFHVTLDARDYEDQYEERTAWANANVDLSNINVAPFKGFEVEETEEELQQIDSFFTKEEPQE